MTRSAHSERSLANGAVSRKHDRQSLRHRAAFWPARADWSFPLGLTSLDDGRAYGRIDGLREGNVWAGAESAVDAGEGHAEPGVHGQGNDLWLLEPCVA